MDEFKITGNNEKEYVMVTPAYSHANKEDQLLCLRNIQSWIDGEKIRIKNAK